MTASGGKVLNEGGLSYEKNCEPGYYCPSGTAGDAPQMSPAGYYTY
jgi:hypothetical protein